MNRKLLKLTAMVIGGLLTFNFYINLKLVTGMVTIVKSVVIASEDPVVINELSTLLIRHDYSIIIEKSTIKSIIKILEHTIDFLILDFEQTQNSNMDLINIIRKTRPRLPIVVLSEDTSLETIRLLATAGVFYCALKPIQITEIDNVIEAINRYYQKDEEMGSFIKKSIEQKKIKQS